MLHAKQGVVPYPNLPRSCTNTACVGEDGTFLSGHLPGSDVVWICQSSSSIAMCDNINKGEK